MNAKTEDMKKLRDQIEQYIESANHYWQSLPRTKQRILTLAILLSYMLATLLSTLSLWTAGHHSNKDFPKEHIRGIQSGIKKRTTAYNINQVQK